MLNKSEILANIEVIKTTIDNFNGLDTMSILDYLGEITSIQCLGTETEASAKYLLLEAINNELDRQAKLLNSDKIAPSIKKMRADAMCREWHYIYELSSNYNRDITHTIDAVRTKISYLKTEINNLK